MIDGLTSISLDNDTVIIRKPIEKYQNLSSIKVMQENINTTNNFPFYSFNPKCISILLNNAVEKDAFSDELEYGDILNQSIKKNLEMKKKKL